MLDHGSFVISLDYELMWGMHDRVTKDGYGHTHVQNVPEVMERLLSLIRKYDVHVTIATVGMIMYDNKETLLGDLPDSKPSYVNKRCSPYDSALIDQIQNDERLLFFQPDVVERLKGSSLVEIGCHTFCHYYCWEKGQTIRQFEDDMKKAVEIAQRNGITLKSIVFPRNQVSQEHLQVCYKYGIKCYRGNALKYFNQPRNKFEWYKNRICRIFDAYLNVGGMTSFPYTDIDKSEKPINIRASRMLRPFSPKLAFLDGLRLKRMCNEMRYAAKHNECYHIWWHPHNFGANINENLAFLEKLLQCFSNCNQKYGMKSYSMSELIELI